MRKVCILTLTLAHAAFLPVPGYYNKISILSRSLAEKIKESNEAAERAASLPIMLCHGKGHPNYHKLIGSYFKLVHVRFKCAVVYLLL